MNEQKRIKIIKTAFEYLLNHPSNKQPRFDVIEVLIGNGKFNVNHIKQIM